jgi:outer membrane protein TolC
MAKIEAESDLMQAQQDRSIAFIALYKALGGAPLPAMALPEPAP